MLLTTVDVDWLSKQLIQDERLDKSFEHHHQSKTAEEHVEAERKLYLKLKEQFGG